MSATLPRLWGLLTASALAAGALAGCIDLSASKDAAGPAELAAYLPMPDEVPDGFELVEDDGEGDSLLDRYHMSTNPGVADEDQFWSDSGTAPDRAVGVLYWGTEDLDSQIFVFALEFRSERGAERYLESGEHCAPGGARMLAAGAIVVEVEAAEEGGPYGGPYDYYPPPPFTYGEGPFSEAIFLPPSLDSDDDGEAARGAEDLADLLGERLTLEDVCARPEFAIVDHDNRRTEANALSAGTNGPFAITPRTDRDWYRIDAPGEARLLLEVHGPESVPDLQLEDAWGGWRELRWTEPDFDTYRSGAMSSYRATLEEGTYFLVAQTYGSRIEEYTLELAWEDPTAHLTDADNDAEHATPVEVGRSGPYAIDPEDDEDWFSFTLEARLQVVLETAGPSGDSELWLYDNGVEIAHSDDWEGTWSRIEATLDPGTYHARVTGFGQSQSIDPYFLVLATGRP